MVCVGVCTVKYKKQHDCFLVDLKELKYKSERETPKEGWN